MLDASASNPPRNSGREFGPLEFDELLVRLSQDQAWTLEQRQRAEEFKQTLQNPDSPGWQQIDDILEEYYKDSPTEEAFRAMMEELGQDKKAGSGPEQRGLMDAIHHGTSIPVVPGQTQAGRATAVLDYSTARAVPDRTEARRTTAVLEENNNGPLDRRESVSPGERPLVLINAIRLGTRIRNVLPGHTQDSRATAVLDYLTAQAVPDQTEARRTTAVSEENNNVSPTEEAFKAMIEELDQDKEVGSGPGQPGFMDAIHHDTRIRNLPGQTQASRATAVIDYLATRAAPVTREPNAEIAASIAAWREKIRTNLPALRSAIPEALVPKGIDEWDVHVAQRLWRAEHTGQMSDAMYEGMTDSAWILYFYFQKAKPHLPPQPPHPGNAPNPSST